MPIRKVIAAALGALITTAGFMSWLSGSNAADFRTWLAVIVTAVVPVIVSYVVPADPSHVGTSGWWPLRKVAAMALTALASSTVFLAWLAGTGDASGREVFALLVAAVLPSALGYLVPAPDVPAGGDGLSETEGTFHPDPEAL